MKYSLLFSTLFVALVFHTNVYSQIVRFDSVEIRFKGLQVNHYYHSLGGHCNGESSNSYFDTKRWVLNIKTDTTIIDTTILTSNTQFGGSDVTWHNGNFFTVFNSNGATIDSFLFHYEESYNSHSASRNIIIKFVNVNYIEDNSVVIILIDSSIIKKSRFYYNDLTTYYSKGECEIGEYFTTVLDTNCSAVVTFYKHDPNSYTKQLPTTSSDNFIFPTLASSSLNIHFQNLTDDKLVIGDLLGREVLVRDIAEGGVDFSVNVASLLNGVYWCRVGSRVQKFIVQH